MWRRRVGVVALVSVGAVIGWRAWNGRNARVQAEAVAVLERTGARVQYGIAGEKYHVVLDDHALCDNDLIGMMPHMRALEPLASLSLCLTNISDTSVPLLLQCDTQALHLTNTKVSAAGIAELQRGMPHTWINHDSLPQ